MWTNLAKTKENDWEQASRAILESPCDGHALAVPIELAVSYSGAKVRHDCVCRTITMCSRSTPRFFARVQL